MDTMMADDDTLKVTTLSDVYDMQCMKCHYLSDWPQLEPKCVHCYIIEEETKQLSGKEPAKPKNKKQKKK